MAVPKKKTPTSHQGSRLSQQGLKAQTLSECSKCKQPKMPHMACLECGFYDGKEVLKIETLQERKKRQEKRDSQMNQ